MQEINESSKFGRCSIVTTDLGVVTQNTWYEALRVTNGAISFFAYRITVADETVEARVTIDGTTLGATGTVNLVAGGNAVSSFDLCRVSNVGAHTIHSTAPASSVDSVATLRPILEGKTILVEIRKTTNTGASHIIVHSISTQG